MNRRLDRDLLEALIYVCIGIGEQVHYAPVGESITYKTDSKIVSGKHTTDGCVREAIYFLQDEGAVRVIKEHVRPWKHFDQYVSWELEVIKDKLKETETKIQKLYDVPELTQAVKETASTSSGYVPSRFTGWELVEDNVAAYIKHSKIIAYTFPKNWSAKYKYFKCMWDNYGEIMRYERLYKSFHIEEYPKSGFTTINRNIRSIINKLRNDSKFKKLPIDIQTSKGFILTINDLHR